MMGLRCVMRMGGSLATTHNRALRRGVGLLRSARSSSAAIRPLSTLTTGAASRAHPMASGSRSGSGSGSTATATVCSRSFTSSRVAGAADSAAADATAAEGAAEGVMTETIADAVRKADIEEAASPLELRDRETKTAAPAASASSSAAAAAESAMKRVPLTQPFIPVSAPEKQFIPSGETRITTLPNGLRVATHESASPIANVGVFIDTGSRYETPELFGINHFFENIAFKSTTRRSDYELVRQMSAIGANVMCSAFREVLIMSGEVLYEHVPRVVDTFGDLLSRPAFKDSELAESRELYMQTLEDRKENVEGLLMDAVHSAAYGARTLGNSLYAPEQNLQRFTAPVLRDFLSKWLTPSRMVVAGVGVPHDKFVEMCASAFADLPKDQPTATARAPAIYTGGDDLLHNPELTEGKTHFALAFETASWHSSDLVPMCVLQMMMGGGGSFSAGGPGKGMYSRLYSNVLNQYAWAQSATSFNSIHTDSSLFGIYGISEAADAPSLVQALINESRQMRDTPPDPLELSRAKNQLTSSVFMQLESRSLLLEDVGRQLVTYGKVQTPFDIAALIDAVKPSDITRVASKMLESKPTIAAVGDLTKLPSPEQIGMRLLAAASAY